MVASSDSADADDLSRQITNQIAWPEERRNCVMANQCTVSDSLGTGTVASGMPVTGSRCQHVSQNEAGVVYENDSLDILSKGQRL